MTTTTYRIAPAPKFAGMMSWNCSRCGREEVRPVFLTSSEGLQSFGSGCAAVLLGLPRSAARRVVADADAADRAEAARVELVEERRTRYAAALAAFQSDPNLGNPALDSCRTTYHQTGGAKVHGSFPGCDTQHVTTTTTRRGGAPMFTQSPTLPIGLDWHRSIGSGHFAFGTASDGRAVKVTTVCCGTLVLVETVDGQMMPTATIGHFDSAEEAVDAFGIHQ